MHTKMKNFKKLAVSTMALAMGAALVGSVSGTVAWFQYSTRSTVSYSGASAHCTENLQVRLYEDAIAPTIATTLHTDDVLEDGVEYYHIVPEAGSVGKLHTATDKYVKVVGDGTYTLVAEDDGKYVTLSGLGHDAVGDETWKSDLRLSDVQAYLDNYRASNDYNLRPVTSGVLAANAAATSFKKEPIYQHEGMGSWKDATKEKDYVELPLQFRVADVNGSRTAGDYDTFLAKNVYLSDLQINNVEVANKEDITAALRVSFDGESTNDRTYSTLGTAVNLYGNLDLGGDAGLDIKEAYDYYNTRTVVADTDERDAIVDPLVGDLAEMDDNSAVRQWNGTAWTPIANPYVRYGEATDLQAASTQVAAANLADDSNPYDIVAHGALLGTTKDDGTTLNVTVRIYLEGWQELSGSAVWDDEDYAGSAFKVNMRFSADAHTEH